MAFPLAQALLLVPAALPTSIGPYLAVMAVGAAVAVAGHIIRSRTLILTGIVIVGAVGAIVGFVVGKVS